MQAPEGTTADTGSLLPVLALVFTQLASNSRKTVENELVTRFTATSIPAIAIDKYLERIVKYAPCSHECFVLALVYIDRLVQRNRTFVISAYNIHRLLITSIMVASKFFDDAFYNNAYYARIGGVPTDEMTKLELDFLFMINFRLHVSPSSYQRYTSELTRNASRMPVRKTSLPGLLAPPTPVDPISRRIPSPHQLNTPVPSRTPSPSRSERSDGSSVREIAAAEALHRVDMVDQAQLPLSPTLLRSECERLIREEAERQALETEVRQAVVARTMQLWAQEEARHNTDNSKQPYASPSWIPHILAKIVSEFDALSPSLVVRAKDFVQGSLKSYATTASA